MRCVTTSLTGPSVIHSRVFQDSFLPSVRGHSARCYINGTFLYSRIQDRVFEYLLYAKLCSMWRMFGEGALPRRDCELSLEEQPHVTGPSLYTYSSYSRRIKQASRFVTII